MLVHDGMLQKNNKAISAIFEFAVTKGNLPVVLSGDFNVEIDESEPLKEFLAFGQWHDAAGNNHTPTCLKGKLTSFSSIIRLPVY